MMFGLFDKKRSKMMREPFYDREKKIESFLNFLTTAGLFSTHKIIMNSKLENQGKLKSTKYAFEKPILELFDHMEIRKHTKKKWSSMRLLCTSKSIDVHSVNRMIIELFKVLGVDSNNLFYEGGEHQKDTFEQIFYNWEFDNFGQVMGYSNNETVPFIAISVSLAGSNLDLSVSECQNLTFIEKLETST